MNNNELVRRAKVELSLNIKEVVYKSQVMYIGWEMDNEIWLVKLDTGTHRLITTSHGGLCVLSRESLNVTIKTHQDVLNSLKSLEVWAASGGIQL